jgi:MFS family permease
MHGYGRQIPQWCVGFHYKRRRRRRRAAAMPAIRDGAGYAGGAAWPPGAPGMGLDPLPPPLPPASSDEVVHWGMCALLSGQVLVNFVVRYALPPLQVFIARELHLSVAQRSALLGAFFAGYIPAQFPSGLAVRRWGSKRVATANLVGHTLCLYMLPGAAATAARRSGSSAWLYACLAGVGVSQGPLGPCLAQNKVAWVPRSGQQRALALTLLSLGSKLAGPVAGWAVPTCAARIGAWFVEFD